MSFYLYRIFREEETIAQAVVPHLRRIIRNDLALESKP